MDKPWKTISTKVAYENNWIQVTHRDVINPSGNSGIYGVVDFKNLAIGIVPIDKDGHTWLVRQFRYTLNQYTWEIPEGGCPKGETPFITAQRELQEETGLTAKKWTKIAEFHTSNSVTNEYGEVFLAENLTMGEQALEDCEDIIVKRLPLQEAYQMVLDGKITDSVSMIGLLKAHLLIKAGDRNSES